MCPGPHVVPEVPTNANPQRKIVKRRATFHALVSPTSSRLSQVVVVLRCGPNDDGATGAGGMRPGPTSETPYAITILLACWRPLGDGQDIWRRHACWASAGRLPPRALGSRKFWYLPAPITSSTGPGLKLTLDELPFRSFRSGCLHATPDHDDLLRS